MSYMPLAALPPGIAILASVRACKAAVTVLQHRYSTRSYSITRIAAALVAKHT